MKCSRGSIVLWMVNWEKGQVHLDTHCSIIRKEDCLEILDTAQLNKINTKNVTYRNLSNQDICRAQFSTENTIHLSVQLALISLRVPDEQYGLPTDHTLWPRKDTITSSLFFLSESLMMLWN